MQQKIVVALDGSALAELVLPQAVMLARATHSEMVLLRVAPAPIMTDPLVGSLPAPVIAYSNPEEDEEEAQSYLELVAKRLADEGLTVRTVLYEGDAATGIVTFLQHEPDVLLLAMATHGRSGLSRWLFGSVAEKVLHASPAPLLLVRPGKHGVPEPHPHAYQTILVPLDGSVFAEQALDQAYELASTTGAALVLVSVVPSLDDLAATEVGEIPLWVLEDQEADMKRMTHYLQATARRLLTAGVPVETKVVLGRAAEAILQTADEEHADVIVMATHGRSGLQRLWMGSAALRVVQGATQPVLLIRAREAAPAHAEATLAAAGAH